MTSFKRLLLEAGSHKEPVQFYREVHELFVQHCSIYKSDEQLKRHPADALNFCQLTREILKLPNLSDEAVLGALENHRKIGKRKMTAV